MSEIIEFLNSNKVSTQTKTALSNALSIQRKSSANFINENQKAQRESERQQQALLQHMQKRKARATELIDVAKRSFKKVFDQNASQKDAESLKKTIDN